MNQIWLFTLLLAFESQVAVAQPQPATKMDSAVTAAVRQYKKKGKATGIEIGILKDNKPHYYGFGETQLGNGRLPDERTIFEIGSVTKSFTATLLARAVQEGKVKMDDPVNKFLPDSIPLLEYEGTPITLKTLALHTSGLPANPTNIKYPPEIMQVWTGDPFKDYDDEDLFSFLAHFKLKRKPGLKSDYSNLGYGILGVVLERVYGKSYEELVAEKISIPLGMKDTHQTIPDNDTVRIAKGYSRNGQPTPAWHAKAMAGCGILRSTATDLIAFARAQLSHSPAELAPAIDQTQQASWKHKGEEYTLAWVVVRDGSIEWLYHGGATGGYGCFLAFCPAKNSALVVLGNSPLVDDLAESLLEAIDMG